MRARTRAAATLVLFGLLPLSWDPASAEGTDALGWKTVREDAGIVVSQWTAPEQRLPRFRAVGMIPATPLEVLAVIRDVDRHTEWRDRCRESRVLARQGDGSTVLYNRNDGSWPAADRDVVLASNLTSQDDGRKIEVRFRSIESPLMPPRRGVVRMASLVGYYRLESLGSEGTRVEYQIDVDLGGRVPRFITRYVSEQMPLNTVRGLRAQVAKTRGRYDESIREWLDTGRFGAE
ncbi:MAG: SRPBCC family protein [Deltaproteobacteria bacterium]|nr:SRPBCC family protein [Deltaproteobacteria bacterium]MBW2400223.1 SRPBCC family protein [Deltaproteobacteria bacterium]